jgi:hypothetical protein
LSRQPNNSGIKKGSGMEASNFEIELTTQNKVFYLVSSQEYNLDLGKYEC